MVAPRKKRVRENAKFRAKDISRVKRVAETWQVGGTIDQLDTDELTMKRQNHLLGGCPMINRQMKSGLRCVRLCLESAMVRSNREEELGPERMSGTQEVAQVHGLRYPFCSDGKVSAHATIFSLKIKAFH
jgi:hypothetical protein